MFFKACPKCHGDMYLDEDAYGKFVECIQCGLLRDLAIAQIFAESGHWHQQVTSSQTESHNSSPQKAAA